MLSVPLVSCYPQRCGGSKLLGGSAKETIAPFGRKEHLPCWDLYGFVLLLSSSKYR
jgi:hypothetical protein